MQTDRASLTNTRPDGPRRAGAAQMIARGALLIAVLSAVSRLLGLVRTVVFAQSVGAGCLGTAYVTANTVPNLIYELALGGALASAMVPVLARAASRADSDEVQKAYVTHVSSALLTWAVVVLLPVTVAIAVVARPIAELLIPANPNATCARPAMVGTTTDFIVAFAPQIMLYGVSVVQGDQCVWDDRGWPSRVWPASAGAACPNHVGRLRSPARGYALGRRTRLERA